MHALLSHCAVLFLSPQANNAFFIADFRFKKKKKGVGVGVGQGAGDARSLAL